MSAHRRHPADGNRGPGRRSRWPAFDHASASSAALRQRTLETSRALAALTRHALRSAAHDASVRSVAVGLDRIFRGIGRLALGGVHCLFLDHVGGRSADAG
jgi:hypothetical protein